VKRKTSLSPVLCDMATSSPAAKVSKKAEDGIAMADRRQRFKRLRKTFLLVLRSRRKIVT